MIKYLTLFYSEYIEDIMHKIETNINKDTIDKVFDYYKDELPIDRLNFAKELVLRRSKWMVNYYKKNKREKGGKIL